jgi:SAM-dependent methyltransferase
MNLAEFRAMETDFLDPRPSAESASAPVAGSVNIPAAELSARVHELPPRHITVRVLPSPPHDRAAAEWLAANGRDSSIEEHGSAGGTLPGRLWRPSPFLLDAVAGLSNGRAMDLACGTGRNSAALAMLGWDVAAVDILPDALERAASLAARYGIGRMGPFETVSADIELPSFRPDARFELITLFAFHHPPLLPRLADWLTTGGSRGD